MIRRLLLLLAFALLIAAPRPATAQEGGFPTATAPAPLGGSGTVLFVSQSVDATLYRAADGSYLVDGAAAVRLHNSSRTSSASVTLGWPSWPGGDLRFDAAQLPGFAPYLSSGGLSTYSQSIATTWGDETREVPWLVTQSTLGRDARQRLFYDWTQPLGSGPLLRYTFGLLPAGAWNGAVGSARITLFLPEYASQEMIVRAEPADYTFLGDRIEWLLVEEEPTVNPSVTLVAPHLWAEVETARAALAIDPLGANLRLAELYEGLASVGVAQYAGEAEAALEAAHRAAPANPEPLRRLALLYRRRAAEQSGDLAALEQAATVGEAALQAGASDPETRAAVVQDLLALAEAWRAADPTEALVFLARAEAAGGDPATIGAVRRPLAEAQALALLARDDLAGALALAVVHGLPTDLAPRPWLESAVVHVENHAGERLVRFSVTGDAATLDDRLGGLAQRLSASGFPTEWANGSLTLRLRGSSEEWLRGGRVVAAALGEDRELDLLRDVLGTPEVAYRTLEEPLSVRYGYREQLHLETRVFSAADELRAEAAARDSAWERALLEASADQWQRLADSQRVRVTTRFQAAGTLAQRDWQLAVPADETLEWRGEAPRRDRWLLAGAGGALALLLLLALIWLPSRR